MSIVNLTEDKFKQIEQQLEGAYNSIFHKDDQKYKPKNKTIFGTIEDNLGLITMTAIGTIIFLKVANRYEFQQRQSLIWIKKNLIRY